MRKIWIIIAAGIFSLLLSSQYVVFAKDACSEAGFNDPVICGTQNSDEEYALIDNVANVLNTIFGVVGILCVIFVVSGGIQYSTSQGDPGKIAKGKTAILYSVCGLVITLSAFAITNTIIVSLGGDENYVASDDSDRNKVKGILSISETSLLAGQIIQIHADVYPDYATNHHLTYSIDDPNVASIDSSGVLKAKREGKATVIISSDDGPTKNIAVTVKKPIPVTAIKLGAEKIKLKKNKTKYVSAAAIPSNASDKTLIWASKNPKVATVTQDGMIRAITSGEETIVTVTARNQTVFSFSDLPNETSVSSYGLKAAGYGDDPVVAEIKVIVENEFYACTDSTANKKFSGDLGFRKITQDIIDKHAHDFDYRTHDSKISSAGGYTRYVKNLGGLFNMFAGHDAKIKVKSACDFQAAAEYAFGLWAIWGVDYDNGSTYHDWGDETSDESDAYYRGSGNRHAGAGYAYKDIDTNMSEGPFRTNCNYSSDAMIRKTDLYFEDNFSSRYIRTAELSKVGKIRKVSDLQVGDMVHYFRNGAGWRHVALVGEVYSDYVVLYDGGGRFISTKQYKKKVPRYGSMINGTTYGSYDDWYAVRLWNIDQSRVLEGLK